MSFNFAVNEVLVNFACYNRKNAFKHDNKEKE